MDRRRLLATLAGAGTASIAGCVSDGRNLTTNDTEPSNESSGSQTEETEISTQEALDEAEENIDRAVDLIEDEAVFSFSRGPDASISTDAIQLALDQASEAITRAEESPGNVDEVVIVAYQNYVSALRQFTAGLDTFGTALNTLSTAAAYRNTERYNDATTQIEDALSQFDEASDVITGSQESMNSIDIEVLDTDAISRARTIELYEDLIELANAYSRYSEATAEYYEGLGRYWTGVDEYDNENYDAADTAFLDAYERFGAAQTQYREGESEVSASVRDVFIELTCVTGAMAESADHFLEATVPARDDDFTSANEAVDAAVQDRNRNCQT